jgi:penicillin-binding protein 2
MIDRLKFFKIAVTFVLLILIIRAGQLQLMLGNYFYELAEGNRLSERPVSAPRGKILDINGNVLVSNREAYNLYIMPNEVPPEVGIDDLLLKLEKLTGIDSSIMKENYNLEGRSSSAVLIKRNISRETMVIIQENSSILPGIFIEASSMREYVYGNFAAHLLGYVGEISSDELRMYSQSNHIYRGGDIVGKTGLEREYELYLRGENGIEQIEVNSRGEKVKTVSIKPPIPGNDLILNIDLELQQYVEQILEEELYRLRDYAKNDPELYPPTGAAAIVMDPNTGKILSMVSVPKYDPNAFVRGLTYEEYDFLNNDPLKPLYDRTIMSQVNPGSVFKLVTGTAAIENLGVTADTVFTDSTGKYTIGEWEYRNWLTYGEGKLNFTKAIARSNNVVFYQLGHRLYNEYGGDMLAWTARQYGFGSKTGIDLPGEKEGLVPDNEWKLRTQGEIWYPGDAVHLAIGQKITTTPIQLINFISAIANGGTLYRPYLVDRIIDSNNEIVFENKPEIIRRLPFKSSTYNILKKGMYEAANASYGTASKYFADLTVKVAGKTGTAQTGAGGANHGWFAGFVPADKPEIAVLVFLQEGNSSSYTLPIARSIIEKYFFSGFQDE